MAFGTNVRIGSNYRICFFERGYNGRVAINRDSDDGDMSHPFYVGKISDDGNGAHLTGGGVWTNASSRDTKVNFKDLESSELMGIIQDLPVQAWEYKGTGERHIFPCAEDFHAAFDIGVKTEDGTRDNKYLSAMDVSGVALAGVKELAKQNEELRQIIQELQSRITQLDERWVGSSSPIDSGAGPAPVQPYRVHRSGTILANRSQQKRGDNQ